MDHCLKCGCRTALKLRKVPNHHHVIKSPSALFDWNWFWVFLPTEFDIIMILVFVVCLLEDDGCSNQFISESKKRVCSSLSESVPPAMWFFHHDLLSGWQLKPVVVSTHNFLAHFISNIIGMIWQKTRTVDNWKCESMFQDNFIPILVSEPWAKIVNLITVSEFLLILLM